MQHNARPFVVMAKPVGSRCNMRCAYCYYLEKKELYKAHHSSMLMDDHTLETYIRQYIEAQTQPQVLFTWHGGEPLLRPLSFYKRVLELQEPYTRRGYIIDNSLQTNGTLLTDEWCAFFREHNWLIGISIDGPQELHDAYRRDCEGQSSFHQVMRGIRLLQKHGVEWNAMAVVTRRTTQEPEAFSLGDYIFVPGLRKAILEKNDDITAYAVKPDGTVTEFKCSVGALTDPERQIIADGCLINYYRNH